MKERWVEVRVFINTKLTLPELKSEVLDLFEGGCISGMLHGEIDVSNVKFNVFKPKSKKGR